MKAESIMQTLRRAGRYCAGVAAILLWTVALAGCFAVVPLTLPPLSKPEPIQVDTTRTDRELTALLPKELALDYLSSHPSDNRCVFTETGIQWFGDQLYEFPALRATESKLKTNDQYVVWVFLSGDARTDQLLCSWNTLTAKQSEKLLTALVSLGVNYR